MREKLEDISELSVSHLERDGKETAQSKNGTVRVLFQSRIELFCWLKSVGFYNIIVLKAPCTFPLFARQASVKQN